MLLALQTTAEGLDDDAFDVLTLFLLVGFVLSMVALSVVLARRERESPEDETSRPAPTPITPILPPPTVTKTRAIDPPGRTLAPSTPEWLAGVTLPLTPFGLSDATLPIERLLAARRNRDLAAGIALYSATLRAQLAAELGVTEDRLVGALEEATIEGDPTTLKSVELLSASSDAIKVRAGYANRNAEVYRLVRIDGRWEIDSIERA